jgi:hypothetical protein
MIRTNFVLLGSVAIAAGTCVRKAEECERPSAGREVAVNGSVGVGMSDLLDAKAVICGRVECMGGKVECMGVGGIVMVRRGGTGGLVGVLWVSVAEMDSVFVLDGVSVGARGSGGR